MLAAVLAGCTEMAGAPEPGGSTPTPPPLSSEPIGVQVTRAEPRLAGTPFRVLLDFERATDLAFLAPRATPVQLTTERAHTGRGAVQLGGGGPMAVKLGSVLSGAFPGKWTVAGAYVYNAGPAPAKVTVAYGPVTRTVDVRAAGGDGGWTPVMIDLTPLGASGSAEAGQLTFEVADGAAGPLYCDDVLVIDNAKVLEAPAAGAPAESGWTIRQRGFTVVVERPNRFKVTLKTPEAAADGWTVEEACDLRARFASATGKTWTMYADGRQYLDGQFSLLVNAGDADVAAAFAAQHASPAEVTVLPEFGRLDRDTPGDRNNDGYNERRGAYQLIARGPRFEATIRPNTRTLVRPVLEVAGLPAGTVQVTVEGQLVDRTTRLANGTVLIDLPLGIERATTVNVNVK
jgi:hypothetical protein